MKSVLQRGQAMVEMALVLTIFMTVVMGVMEVGRFIYVYVSVQGAAVDGARVAVRYSFPLPTNSDVEAVVKSHSQSIALANPCPNGPVVNPTTPNTGYVFITGTPAQTTYDAPGGINPADPPGCNAVVPASGNVELTVTVRYLYQPMTPMVAALIGNSLIISASSTMRTEY